MGSPLFETVKQKQVKSSNFDLTHSSLLTCDMGYLVPSYISEVLPGDTFDVNTTSLVKFMPLIAPIMSKIDVYIHNFFVPARLLNSHFEDFITGGENGTYATPLPYVTFGQLATEVPEALVNGSLLDYLGLPTFGTDADSEASEKIAEYRNNSTIINLAPIEAYNLIWQEYYRDQNLEDKILDKTQPWFNAQGNYTGFFSEQNFPDFFSLRKRAWQKDYFTSALPFAQKGTPVAITMSGQADVKIKSGLYPDPLPLDPSWQKLFSDHSLDPDTPLLVAGLDSTGEKNFMQDGNGNIVNIDPNGTLYVKASDFSFTTINELRFAYRAQEFLEKNARGGSRYIESLLSHFGVLGKDARLQRPQYLGGSKNTITITENLQTSSNSETSVLGQQSGQALCVDSSKQFRHYFDEHGYIIQIMSIMPKAVYKNGLPKLWSRVDKLDYAWPEFGNLGEQEILRQEVNYLPESVLNPTTQQPANTETFGYTPRYAEYKFENDKVHGEFKNTLQTWHLARDFGSNIPYLSPDFIHCSPRTDIFNFIGDEEPEESGIANHHILVQLLHKITANRKLPFYGTPTF